MISHIRKHKSRWIMGWLGVLTIFNVLWHWPQNAAAGIVYVLLDALSYLTSPIELILSALAICIIVSVASSSKEEVDHNTCCRMKDSAPE
jgi:hypothetical protein